MTYLYPEQELKRRALAWALQLKVNPRDVRVVPMKEKWGSCSASGDVMLSEDLIAVDRRFQDYVIVHELLHLRVRSHGKLFKALMGAYIPQWRELEEEAAEREVRSESQAEKW